MEKPAIEKTPQKVKEIPHMKEMGICTDPIDDRSKTPEPTRVKVKQQEVQIADLSERVTLVIEWGAVVMELMCEQAERMTKTMDDNNIPLPEYETKSAWFTKMLESAESLFNAERSVQTDRTFNTEMKPFL